MGRSEVCSWRNFSLNFSIINQLCDLQWIIKNLPLNFSFIKWESYYLFQKDMRIKMKSQKHYYLSQRIWELNEITETHLIQCLAHSVWPINKRCIFRYISLPSKTFTLIAFIKLPKDNHDLWKLRQQRDNK